MPHTWNNSTNDPGGAGIATTHVSSGEWFRWVVPQFLTTWTPVHYSVTRDHFRSDDDPSLAVCTSRYTALVPFDNVKQNFRPKSIYTCGICGSDWLVNGKWVRIAWDWRASRQVIKSIVLLNWIWFWICAELNEPQISYQSDADVLEAVNELVRPTGKSVKINTLHKVNYHYLLDLNLKTSKQPASIGSTEVKLNLLRRSCYDVGETGSVLNCSFHPTTNILACALSKGRVCLWKDPTLDPRTRAEVQPASTRSDVHKLEWNVSWSTNHRSWLRP